MRLEEALLYYRQGHRIRIVEPRVTGSKNKNYIMVTVHYFLRPTAHCANGC